uniref:Uncharacterized protein n=1 Tax=Oryza brachyantha TaxID=4533 RepID=J3MY32_ORYBR
MSWKHSLMPPHESNHSRICSWPFASGNMGAHLFLTPSQNSSASLPSSSRCRTKGGARLLR